MVAGEGGLQSHKGVSWRVFQNTSVLQADSASCPSCLLFSFFNLFTISIHCSQNNPNPSQSAVATLSSPAASSQSGYPLGPPVVPRLSSLSFLLRSWYRTLLSPLSSPLLTLSSSAVWLRAHCFTPGSQLGPSLCRVSEIRCHISQYSASEGVGAQSDRFLLSCSIFWIYSFFLN